MLKIYFKPNCSTCQTALKLARENTKEEIQTIEYLVDIPKQKDIKALLKMLGINAEQFGLK